MRTFIFSPFDGLDLHYECRLIMHAGGAHIICTPPKKFFFKAIKLMLIKGGLIEANGVYECF